ncbi:MAG: type II toxin-antitoxin system RelE/ParE family toxin [Nevskiales bacterium]
MKPLAFLGSSLEDLRAFPEAARRRTGFELRLVQRGVEPTDWKPMRSIGPGVREIRIRTGGTFRVLYLVHRGGSVYVLHAFQKKTQKTPAPDIELSRQRLRLIGD